MEYHNPVLLNECIQGLAIKPTGIYVDVTFGGGGHSKLILKNLDGGKLYAFDQDKNAHENALSDGDELGKGENNGNVGGLTDINTRTDLTNRNTYNDSNGYSLVHQNLSLIHI